MSASSLAGPPSLLDPAEVERAHAHCHELVQARAKNFAYTFLLLPRARRRGIEAIYAYCRLADDFADDESIPEDERARRLADLRARLRRALPLLGEPEPAPLEPDPELDLLLLALADTAGRFELRRDDLDLVAQGCEQDLRVTRYETFADLYDYCYMVASAVGLACLDVFGYRGDRQEVRSHAVDLGIAMQLTNILRDVSEDLARDRVYLPQEDLRRFGVTEAQLAEGRVDEAWRKLAAFQLDRARRYFVRGTRLARFVRRRSRVCPLALAKIYGALLDAIEERDYDVFSERISLESRRKLGLVVRSLGRGLAGG